MTLINAALIVASGRGSRAGGDVPKQYQLIGDKPVLWHTINNFINHQKIDKILVVIHPDDVALYESVIAQLDATKILPHSFGGTERQYSVTHGLKAISHLAPQNILIHDGARPFLTTSLIDDLIAACDQYLGAIAATPITDTIKSVKNKQDEYIDKTLDRDCLWAAQTPQAFDFNTIIKAHADVSQMGENKLFTDDAAIFEYFDISVKLVKSTNQNIKITHPEDFLWANAKLALLNGDI
ncbi:MAG: 2-C-methyl-D-erythritol 4-phosphate cytidylyltransferase [Rhizobiales bacterium]|nr:2-C-methyl-D-erythritol 4-phosphate cytidylyltransferase [Hyphomicrobiales bacterium]